MKVISQHTAYGGAHNQPNMIVIHCMAEYVKDVDGKYIFAPRALENMGLSAHVLVAPNGDLYRCRDDNEGAYHAKDFNTDSLGIEILVSGKHDYASFSNAIKTDWATEQQFKSAVAQCREWVKLYGITKIVRHSDLSPGRKIDPGAGFKWGKFLAAIKKVET
jgi:N-acetylmuramoyl-L-alanine amidase